MRTAAAAAPSRSKPGGAAYPAPPKRAKNAYLVFLARHEPVVAAQHVGWSRNQVMNVVAAMWKKVSPEEKVRARQHNPCPLQRALA